LSCTVGVDVGGTNVRVVLEHTKGKIVSRLSETSEKRSGPTGLSRQIVWMIRSLELKGRIRCVGIGAAGPLDLKHGCIVHSPHLGYERIPLVKPLERELGVPVYLVNDCVAAVIAEKEFGQGKKHANVVYVTISSGIGAGVFVDDHLLIGKDGNAHEVGHITVDHTGRLVCGCGRRGHWEAYCGGANTSNFIKYQFESKTRTEIESSLLFKTCRGNLSMLISEDLFNSARRHDRLALEIVEEMGRFNALGFANVTDAYDPELITVGGAVALANPNLILGPIRRMISRYSLNRIPRIEMTKLGEDAVLYGALVLSRHLKRRSA